MKLGFFTMPIHPVGRDYAQTLREDRELTILADDMGFVEGYFCEHFTPELIWRREWQDHPNGVNAILEFIVVSKEPLV